MRAAAGRTVDLHLSAQGGDAIGQASEPASVRAGSSHSVVAYVDVQLLILNPRRDGSASRARMFGEVRQRFCDDEVRVRLDLGTESVSGHLDANG